MEYGRDEEGYASAMTSFVGTVIGMVKNEIDAAAQEEALRTHPKIASKVAIAANGFQALENVQEEMKFLVWCAMRKMYFPEQLRKGTARKEECDLFANWLHDEAGRKLPYAIAEMQKALDDVKFSGDERMKILYAEFCRLSVKDRMAVCTLMKNIIRRNL